MAPPPPHRVLVTPLRRFTAGLAVLKIQTESSAESRLEEKPGTSSFTKYENRHLEAFHYPLPSEEVILSPINPPERPNIPLTSIPLISIRTLWSCDWLPLRQWGESCIKIPTPLKDYADYFPLLFGVLVLAVLQQPECCVAPSFRVCLMNVFRQQQEVAVLSDSCSRPCRGTHKVILRLQM